MKNLFIKKLLFLLFISVSAVAQDGKFSFTLPSSVTTSAGVFKNDSILIKTLWNNVNYKAGTYTQAWDGKDDNGNAIANPDATYKIKVLSNNVKYSWQGTVGNSSDSLTGITMHKAVYHCMRGLVFNGSYGYFCTGYGEGAPTIAKFNVATPNQKIPLGIAGDINYVAADATTVYWGAFDSNSPNNSWVFGTSISNDQETSFSSGVSYAVIHGKTFPYAISKLNQANSAISGMAVQKTGIYLFVARAGLNQVQVLNKTTGALVQTLTYTNPRGLSVDNANNLWMATAANTVAKYTVNTDGTLTAPVVSLGGLVSPLATQVTFDGSQVAVTDGGSSQQVKFYDNNSGTAANTIGSAGGYASDATVGNSKFYFSDVNGSGIGQYSKVSFIAFQPDGSYWVNDPGNFRVQHYSSNGTFINRIMSLGSNYSVFADKNNISKVFAEFLEFEIDYNVQNLSGNSGWVLKRSWGSNIPTSLYNGSPRFQTTLSNGRTYGLIRKNNDWEVVEFPTTGQLRFTGIILQGLTKILCNDGSLQDYTTSGATATLKRFPLTGFDGAGNPQWSSTAVTLASGQTNNVSGGPIEFPNSQCFSSTNKVVFFNPKAYANDAGPIYSTGYHLAAMTKGSSNAFLFQTEKSTHRNYSGDYPPAGYFDCGNLVNDYAGGSVNIIDRNIITSYHGEFWKNSQTNKYNHYYDNGLAIGQFGITGPEMTGPASAMMAGNALTPVAVKDANGDLYLWHGDESHHAAIHRWKITGLSTIAEQVVTIPYPSAYNNSNTNYLDLMVGLPFDNVLNTNTAGWTRNPAVNNEVNPYSSLWRANTSKISFGKLTDNDVSVEALIPNVSSATVARDLGTNSVSTNWKLTGNISYGSDNNVNNSISQQYLEVLDAAGKVLVQFYVTGTYMAPTFVYGNTAQIAKATGKTIEREIAKTLPFEVKIDNGVVTFTYGNYPPVSTTISDASGNWRAPKTMQLRFNGSGGGGYKQMVAVQNFKFYKDFSNAPAANIAPVANAGSDKVITLPVNSTSLSGSGTDADGTISSYAWVKISGPTTGAIGTANAATTTLSNLTQGVYQYELTVTDNSGATGKDTVQVTVNTVTNVAPVANAGSNTNITLPVNSTTLSGSATDADGTVSTYSWIKISGPSTGSIATANAATTTVNNLVQGVYQFELTVTDNGGAIGKDTVQVTVIGAVNVAPIANAGSNVSITLPVNSTTISGSATDADGTVSTYSWIKISGPATGSIAVANSATTAISNLVQGVYQFELTVTDNGGAIGKDTIQVTVNGLVNVAPVANAGTDITVMLPVNTITLSGSGTDADGSISSYSWVKISGPTAGKIASSIVAVTVVSNLVQGVYKYELTVTDNNGAISKDTVQATVKPGNVAPVANAGSNISITLPVNTTTLSGSGTDADGTISSYGWVKISGPASGTIATSTAASTVVNGLVQGVYQYELTVTDNSGAKSTDTVQVTVNAANNIAPVANAGSNISITLPVNTTTLSGSGTDADGTISSYGWVKISGPASGTIATATAATTVVSGLVQGVYQYELTVTDNSGAKSKDTVQVTVNAANNIAPVANAGSNISITLPVNTTTLSGSGTDADGTISSYGWVKISGPASGAIATATAATTVVSGLVQGIYQYELTVTDNSGAKSKDTVQVTVNAASNIAPVANAGSNISITLPVNTTTLSGSGTDADGTISSYGWVKISGPTSGTIATATAATTVVSGLVQGVYQYELTVTDNSGTKSKDTVQVTVNAANNTAPVANAGSNISITLPVNTTTLSGSGTDADGTISSYGWVKISGPASGAIATATAATTVVSGLVQGVYQYELTVTDNSGAKSKDTVQVTVNAAGNLPPTANAGSDKTITLPANNTTLLGSGVDPDGTIASYAWVKISGPASGKIASTSSAVTAVSNLVQGVYKYELTVTDNKGLKGKDTVQVTVNAATVNTNIKPVANAGSDVNIVLPTNSVQLSGTGTDADGTIGSYSWRVISGPTGFSFTSATQAVTTIGNLFQGVYILELTVVDNQGALATDTMNITVSSPRLSGNTTNEFKVYPNPVKDVANISITTANFSTKLYLTVVDLKGTIVKASELTTKDNNTIYKLDMSNMTNGYYVITIRFDDGRLVSSRVLKYGR